MAGSSSHPADPSPPTGLGRDGDWEWGAVLAADLEAAAGDHDGELTAAQLRCLAAWDRVGDAADEDRRPPHPLPGAADEPAGGDDPPGPVVPLGLTPRRLGRGGGFEAGGAADRVPPGPVLAGLAAGKQADGLGRVSDDELAGLMIAWRKIASWAAAGEWAAVAELDRRREAAVATGADPHLAEHVADEIAIVLTMTSRAAGTLVDRAAGLARLPRTMAALRTGAIDVPKALVIIRELAGLDGVHAARVEAALIGRAGGLTTGELGREARQQVLAADPDAARKRKEKAARDARVERWAEGAGTAALAGRDLPPAGVLAADAHLTGWARRLKQAGMAGSMDQLRARVYLALLNGQDPESMLSSGAEGAVDAGGADDGSAGGGPAGCGSPGGRAAGGGPGPRREEVPGVPAGLAGGDRGRAAAGRASTSPGQARPAVRGSVNLILPLSALLGWSQAPGEVAGWGPVDAVDSRALAAALARDPATTWCLTLTGADGRALAHGCARRAPGSPAAPGAQPVSGNGGNGQGDVQRGGAAPDGAGGSCGAGAGPPPGVRAWLAGMSLAWLETGTCDHPRETPAYRPSRALAHLMRIRHQTCIAPGCRRPATACDFEHTVAYQRGGRTCECNGAPMCRRHHRAKQTQGWHLEQPSPGILVWTLPSGRRFTRRPTVYPGG